MGHYRRIAQGWITSFILVTVLVTTFLPDWVAPAPMASAASNPTAGTAPDISAVESANTDASNTPSIRQPASLVPMNTLILSAPGRTEALEAAITTAGDTVHIRQGDALFVGLETLGDSDLAALGARALYHGRVPDAELTALSGDDRDAALTWNAVNDQAAGTRAVTLSNTGANSSVLLIPDNSASASASYAPSDTQTSAFLYGKVAVKVLFIESTGGTENWTETEVNKVKSEVVQALDWWTVAATVPETPGEPARPPAQLVWDISYVSPFDGESVDRPKIQVGIEPIEESVYEAASNWIPQVAYRFVNPATPVAAAARKLADNTRDATGSDWGFVLYVVDSSADVDGYFNVDKKRAGAALNGPWAVVTYDAGDMGTENLEVVIAKMVGHVFGAGDETYDTALGGCYGSEIYGYLSVLHDNCERDADPALLETSLMRDGQNMFDAYQTFQLSESARKQVGWRDADEDGIYDVVDTLSDTFTGLSPDPVCPTLHLTDIDIDNTPALPAGIIDPVGAQWPVHVWDPEADAGLGAFMDIPLYTPVNINRPGYVWGRVNEAEWLGGDPADNDGWNEEFEAYNIKLLGQAGIVNEVEIAIMDRWGQVGYMSSPPVTVTIATPPAYILGDDNRYESNLDTYVDLFDADGRAGGWTTSAPGGYSGTTTMTSNDTGSEACFAFNGVAVKILHTKGLSGTANVLVDGELHSTIAYPGGTQTQAVHYIANLLPGNHTVQIEAAPSVIDFDAFEIFNPDPDWVIDAQDPADIPLSQEGFYEQSGFKILRAGSWSTITLDTSARPAPQDSAGLRSVRPYDRIYAYFTHANVAAFYRKVFTGGGTAYVYVDGEYRGIMNNEAAYTAVMPFYIGGLDPNTVHAIEFRINPGTPRIDFDAVRLLNLNDTQVHAVTTPGESLDVPYNGAHESYGKWEVINNNYIQANDEGDLQNVFFKGSAVAVLVRTDSDDGGIIDLYADGRLMRSVNLKVKDRRLVPIVLHGFDPSLPHVFQVRHHNKNPDKLRWTRIDGYRVYNIPPVDPSVNNGVFEEYEYDASGNPTESVFIYEQKWKFPAPYTEEPGPSDDRYIRSGHPQSRAYLYFTGADTLRLYAVAKDGYGTAELWVDGQLKGLFYLTSASTRFNVPYTITGMNPTTTHVLEIRIKKKTGLISLDKVVLYNRPILDAGTWKRLYENDGEVDIGGGEMVPALQFSGQWTTASKSSASGTFHVVGSIEDQVVFSVKDTTSVVIYRRLHPKFGKADVYVDGKYYTSFGNYISTPDTGVYQQPFVIAGLDPTFNHEIKIVPQRYGSDNTSYKRFDIDYIVVRKGDTGGVHYLIAGPYENNDPIALNGGAISYVGSSWTSGDVSTAQYKGEKAVIVFYGNAFTTYFNKASNGGKARISIDGQLVGTFSAFAGSPVAHVPFSVGGLDEALHTAEISVLSGKVSIDAYQVYSLTPTAGPTTFDLTTDTRFLKSEEWFVQNGYLKTLEEGAKLILYVTGGDTLFITHESWDSANSIKVYINGKLHSKMESAYLRTAPQPEATYIISGLVDMRTEGFWVEILNPGDAKISLKQLEVGSMTPALAEGQSVEAEGTAVVHAVGRWEKRPDSASGRYSGGFGLQTINKYAAFYIPTAEGVRYVTVYRNLGDFGNVNVFIDGEFWGLMPNKSSLTRYAVPFSIGPIPDTPGVHIVELRQATSTAFLLDRVVGHGSDMLQPGYYEDTESRLLYTGKWKKIFKAQASGGTMHKSVTKGDQLTATFMGNEITLIFRTSLDGGRMMAYIDGDAYPIRTRSATPVYGVQHTILLPSGGPHSLALMNSTGARIDLDAINIRSRAPVQYGAYQEDASQVVLNTSDYWKIVTAADHSGGAYAWTKKKFASAFLLFYGQRVTTYMTTGKDWGKVSFYIDGQLYEKVVQYAKGFDTPFYAYEITGLPAGNHVLEIRFEGERDGKKGEKQANFDVITVNGAPAPQPGDVEGPKPDAPRFGCYEEDNDAWTFIGPDNAWTLRTNTGASGDQYYEATAWDNVYAEFHFAAAGFDLLYHKDSTGGLADVYLDGTKVTTLNMNNSTSQWLEQAQYTYPDPLNPNVVHILRIVQAGSGKVYIDRLDLPSYDPAYNDACPD